MAGHTGYLTTCARALPYAMRLHGIEVDGEVDARIMEFRQGLSLYSEVRTALQRLSRSVILSRFLMGTRTSFSAWSKTVSLRVRRCYRRRRSRSVQGPVLRVYCHAATKLGPEPYEYLMVSANTFEVIGARACGYRSAFVNRGKPPCEYLTLLPDLTVPSFNELAARIALTSPAESQRDGHSLIEKST